MAKSSGGINSYAGAGNAIIAVTSNGRQLSAKTIKRIKESSKSLDSLKHREVVKQLNRGISRYEKVMGVRERTIRVANIGDAYGVTFLNSDGSQGIYLNRRFFNQHRNEIESQYRKTEYNKGHKNITNRPIQHTITHELAHATWTSSYSGAKYRAAGKEINSLYNSWSKDKKKTGYGTYGAKNVDDFWAEVVTKGIHGNSDKYTRRAIGIAKRYKL